MGQIHSCQSEPIIWFSVSARPVFFCKVAYEALVLPGGSPHGNQNPLPAAIGFGCRLSATVGCRLPVPVGFGCRLSAAAVGCCRLLAPHLPVAQAFCCFLP